MPETRVDVVKTDRGWIVADSSSRSNSAAHLTSAGALEEATKRARALLALGQHTTVYLWEGSYARAVSVKPAQ